jgi:protoporphyrinogen oxidase
LESTRYLVVGAGVTGLAFADWLDSEDILICEAQAEVGGFCRTVRQDGFIWDYSGHFFHFKHPEIESYLVDRMVDQKVLRVEKVARIWDDGSWVDFPYQKNFHQLPKEIFIDLLVDLMTKDETYGGDGPAANFKEMLYQKFGRGISERFLIPYNEKLYATDLANLDVDAMGRFFPYADVPEIIRNFRAADNVSYNATFTYPEGGAIQYVHALLQGVDTDRLLLSEPVISIDLEAKIARTPTREIAYETIVSSAPVPKLMDLCDVPYDRSIYTWNKVLVFNLGFDRKGLEGVNWVYYPAPDVCFYRVGFYDNIFGTDRMSLYVELGYDRDAVIDEAEVETMRQRVLEDLVKVGVVDDHTLISSHSVTLDPAYVHITQDSITDVAKQRAALSEQGVHSLGRYGGWTYCAIEDNIVEARALADQCNAADAALPRTG